MNGNLGSADCRILLAVVLFALVITSLGGLAGYALLEPAAAQMSVRLTSAPIVDSGPIVQRTGRLSEPERRSDRLYVAEARDGSMPAIYVYRRIRINFYPSRHTLVSRASGTLPIPKKRPSTIRPASAVYSDASASINAGPTIEAGESGLGKIQALPDPWKTDHARAASIVRDTVINASTFGVRKVERSIDEIVVLANHRQPLDHYLRIAGVHPIDRRSVSDTLGDIALRRDDRLDLFIGAGGSAKPLIAAQLIRGADRLWAIARTDSGAFVRGAGKALIADLRRAATDHAAAPDAASLLLREPESGSLEAGLAGPLATAHVPDGVAHRLFDLAKENRIAFTGEAGATDHIDILFRSPVRLHQPQLVYANVVIAGTDHSYYRFRPHDRNKPHFYDADGEKATMFLTRKPVPAGHLGDGFGWRMHPVLHVRKFHEGVDFPAPMGSPILAGGDGVVERISWQKGYGKYVRVRHDEGYETTYAHLSRTAHGLKVGQRVRQGQVIARVGSTGYSTGPHLYYELKVHGHYADPTRQHLRAGRVLTGQRLKRFEVSAGHARAVLAEIDRRAHASDDCSRPLFLYGIAPAGKLGLPCLPAAAPPMTATVPQSGGSVGKNRQTGQPGTPLLAYGHSSATSRRTFGIFDGIMKPSR